MTPQLISPFQAEEAEIVLRILLESNTAKKISIALGICIETIDLWRLKKTRPSVPNYLKLMDYAYTVLSPEDLDRINSLTLDPKK